MSQPGWYPDPSGQPGQFRFWDGAQWSQQTTANPAQTPPPGGGQAPPPRRSGGAGRWVLLVVGVLVVALVGFLVVRGLGGRNTTIAEDTNSSTPTVSQWDETSTPTQTPSPTNPESSGGVDVACPEGGGDSGKSAQNGRLTGGSISVVSLGWESGGFSLPWMYDTSSELKQITSTWVSVNAVGALRVADGFEAPEPAARVMMSCFASSGYYRGFTGRTDVVSEAITIDGHQAYHLRSEIFVGDQGPDIKGDVVDVVVVDTGNPESVGVYVNSATIDDSATQAEVDRSMASIKVD
ncbi:DUF2510 domain-containing protein [Aestuariimicrobium kwangyangense]|uniref:DUF2510 domain-containing protein n=1 Tax=Aestuariimicrobium kwangyangense TaxID=396389 RepID=UPI0003B6D3BE|nr:DUF2510 domain-containing protein [Aestuariimicrobium kwangyangense]